jgi:hypothetical protein
MLDAANERGDSVQEPKMKFLQGRSGRAARERGNALFVAIILLLLASVITLLTLRVGVFEQRTSGNDQRAKLIAQVAEAGIAQGAEFFRLNPGALAADSGNWVACSANDESFPCGSIPDMDVDDGAGGTVKRRGTMYYWSNGTSPGDINNDGTSNDVFDQRMLPLASVVPAEGMIEEVGNFDQVSYGVGVVLCRVAIPGSPGEATRCTHDETEQSSTLVYNFVSVASLPGEGTRTTVSQMLGQYLIFNPDSNKPPIVASGSVDVTGTLQLVTNPNAGGYGVPVSVWTRKDVDKTGTPNTCYYDEFIRYGGGSAEWVGGETKVLVCDDCSCAGDKSLSYDASGNLQDEGIDILDIDGNTPATPQGKQVNYDVKPEEFPCDMFEFVFGVRAREDLDGDFFCESRVPKVSYTSASGVTATLNVDEAFLYSNSDYIIPRADGVSVNGHVAPWTSLASPAQKALPAPYPNAGGNDGSGLSGIVWCQQNCDIKNDLGTPDRPVLLVVDGAITMNGGRVFGLILLRSLEEGALDPSTGGSADLKINGNVTVYGSVVIQGQVQKANGNAAVVYNEDVFRNLANSIPPKDSNLPGAWTDRLSY